MTNTPLLESIIDKSGYKRGYIAGRIGISTYTLSLKVNNRNEFKASEIEALCNILDIDDKDRSAIFFASKVD